jgi:hypothetical protein
MLKTRYKGSTKGGGHFSRHFDGFAGDFSPQHFSGCHNYRVCQIKPWFQVSSRVLGSYRNNCIQQYIADPNDPLKYGFLVGS